MSKPKNIPTIQLEQVELAAALECHAPGGLVLTAEDPENDFYMFLANTKTRAAYKKLEDGNLTVNVKDYLEKLKYFKDWREWSHEENKLHADDAQTDDPPKK